MKIQKRLEQLDRMRDEALAGGGSRKIERQHEKGKLTARERVELLLDPGTFREMDMFVVHRCEHFGMEKKRILGDGVITGYTATIDPAAVGSPILIIMRIIHAAGRPPIAIGERAAELPEVIECNRVTGAESHVIRAWCRDLSHLNDLIEIFSDFGETITNVVTDTPVQRRSIRFD